MKGFISGAREDVEPSVGSKGVTNTKSREQSDPRLHENRSPKAKPLAALKQNQAPISSWHGCL